jgi:hypothetical protein
MLDAVLSVVVEAVEGGLGDVEGEGGADGGEVVGDTLDGERIVAEDDNGVEVGEDERDELGELGEVGAEAGEGVADEEGEEGRGDLLDEPQTWRGERGSSRRRRRRRWASARCRSSSQLEAARGSDSCNPSRCRPEKPC